MCWADGPASHTDAGRAPLQGHKYEAGVFGRCPRVLCEGARAIACGRPCRALSLDGLHHQAPGADRRTWVAASTDVVGADTLKVYCPRCRELYEPDAADARDVDGAFFGTTMAPLLLLSLPELAAAVPPPPPPFVLPTATLVPVAPAPRLPREPPAATSDERRQARRDSAVAVAAVRRRRHRRGYSRGLPSERREGSLTHLRNPHPKRGWLPTTYAAPWPGAFRPRRSDEPSSSSSSLSSWEAADSDRSDDSGAPPPAKRAARGPAVSPPPST
jgi:hypothetical protein